MISREDSLKLVKKHVKNINLVYHMIAVSSIMGKMAEKHDEDKQLWEAVGMLHDVDYEETSDDFSKPVLFQRKWLRISYLKRDYMP